MDVMIEGAWFRQRGQGKLEALTFKLGLSGGKKRGGRAERRQPRVGRELCRFGDWSEDRGAELSEGRGDAVREVGQVSSPWLCAPRQWFETVSRE